MRKKLALSILSLGILSAVPALAHHSIAAEFDASKPVTLKGTVTKLDWLNPHIWLYIDVADEQGGGVAHWQCEGGPPNVLTRQGWTKGALKPGDEVTITGMLAKDGSRTCNARSVKLPSGKSVFAGSAEDGGPSASKQ
jgi:hypothetical protein